MLDQTLVIVTADHGEELGEHGLFEHGESLYRPEIRVPLLIVSPPGSQSPGVVREVVSLRDLPATIVDLVGLAGRGAVSWPVAGAIRGRSGSTRCPGDRDRDGEHHGAISELTAPNPTNPSHGRSPATRGPLISLAEGDYVYIRNEGDGGEQLFDGRTDPDEQSDRAADQAMRPVLERMRRQLDKALAPAAR